jgi:hypothetical protein
MNRAAFQAIGRRPAVLAACGLLALLPVSVDARAALVIIDAPAQPCPTCSLDRHVVVKIGDDDGPGILEGYAAGIARDRRGNYYIHDSYGTAIKVFASDGRFVRTIGRPGAGPGEFRGIGAVRVGPGDSLHVFDASLARHLVFSPSLDFAWSVNLQIPTNVDVEILDDGRVVVAASVRTADRVGLPVHVLDQSGRIAGSFGSRTERFRLDDRNDWRTIGPARDGSLWIARRWGAYELEEWTLDGTYLRSISRDRDWPAFRTADAAADAPRPRLQAIRQDAEGRIWTILLVGGRHWRQARPAGAPHGTPVDFASYYDTVIEVLDGRSGELIASARYDEVITHFVDDAVAAGIVIDEEGIPRMHIWQFRILSDANTGA